MFYLVDGNLWNGTNMQLVAPNDTRWFKEQSWSDLSAYPHPDGEVVVGCLWAVENTKHGLFICGQFINQRF